MRSIKSRWAIALLACLALAIPAGASAHPGVYKVTAKTGPASCTYANDLPLQEGACLTQTQTQYVIANDGYAVGFKEDNGVTGLTEGTGGMLNYKTMPTAYRAPMTEEQKRTYAPAQTDVQPHATCTNVAVLSSGTNILKWQERSDHDPFYNYIPWQKASAGLGDEPAKWIPVVKAATAGLTGAPVGGVDLSALFTEAEFKAACEALQGVSAPGHGVYRKADTASTIVTAQVAAAAAQAAAPLEAEVAGLLNDKSSLQSQIDAWKAKAATLEKEKASLAGEKANLAGEVSSLQQQLAATKKADAKKAKTIKRLRKQQKAALRHG